MTYANANAGRADHQSSSSGSADFWTWQAVQERMADAMRDWWRSPDGDARFGLRGRISSIWRECVDDPLALIERHGIETEAPRPLPLSRADMARMVEASEWLRFVPDADRRLVVLVLAHLARGETKVPWLKLKRRLGVKFGADGLRKRYSRAVTCIANALNGANQHGLAVNPLRSPSSK